MDIGKAFKQFCDDLQNRSGIMTEDNIRYYWFATMLRQDKDLNHYTLEEPYQTLSGKEMDLHYQDNNDELYFEIKFHRNNGQSDYHHTFAAGEIFDDLQRLKSIKISRPQSHCYFLYVTDDIMHNYFTNNQKNTNVTYRNNLKCFYDVAKNSNINLKFDPNDTPKTFMERALKSLSRNTVQPLPPLYLSNITMCFTEDIISKNCHVRLYEI